MPDAHSRTGVQILVDQLVVQGVVHMFCGPGESAPAMRQALHASGIGLTVCQQEAGAGMMADAAGRLTGRPGIALVTPGPGALNVTYALHGARHDSVPLILFVAQIARGLRGGGACEEMDHTAVFGSVAKWVVAVDDAARLPALVSRAFQVSLQGRPGPVVIALPADMLTDTAAVADAPRIEPVRAWPGLTQMAELQKLLWAAQRPMMVVGGGGWTDAARASVARFAVRFELPVATSFEHAAAFAAAHPCYAGEIDGGDPTLRERIESADLLILLGLRAAALPTEFVRLSQRATGVHVYPDPMELGCLDHPGLGIAADVASFAASLEGVQPPRDIRWAGQAAAAHAAYLDRSRLGERTPGAFDRLAVGLALRDALPDDAIVIGEGAGDATSFARHMALPGDRLQPAAASGPLGFGLPAAIAAARLAPGRCVVGIVGEDGFLTSGLEFATAVHHGLPVMLVVVSDGVGGLADIDEARRSFRPAPARRPDLAAYARAFGGHGETVTQQAEFTTAFARSRASGLPAVIHVKLGLARLAPANS